MEVDEYATNRSKTEAESESSHFVCRVVLHISFCPSLKPWPPSFGQFSPVSMLSCHRMLVSFELDITSTQTKSLAQDCSPSPEVVSVSWVYLHSMKSALKTSENYTERLSSLFLTQIQFLFSYEICWITHAYRAPGP